MNMSKKKKEFLSVRIRRLAFICIAALPAILFVFPALDFARGTLAIFPSKDSQSRLIAYNDKYLNGNSVIEEFKSDASAIVLRYKLESGASTPMVFTTHTIGTVEKPLDLSGFESVSLKIREATNEGIVLFIKTFLPGISSPEAKNAQTLRHNQYVLRISPDTHLYTIGLREFETGIWWLDMMKVKESAIPKETFTRVISFDMQFNQAGSDYRLDTHEKVVIESISFHRSMSFISKLIIAALIICYASLAGIFIIKKIRKEKLKIPGQKPLEVSSYKEQELARIRVYLESHYNDPEISTRMVYKELGIPQARVFELLKEKYRLTFKQLIIKMRIEEAKRILRETDLRIIDIAFSLGFNNISYFNNLFKTIVGETPSDYRDREKATKK
jgi:AraC-like DNA-binding protein